MPLTLTASSIITEIKSNLHRSLTVGYCASRVSPEEIKLIINELKDNTSITEVTIWSMNDELAEAVADMLAVNSTIQILKLWGAGITKIGALKLAAAFKASCTLKAFDLTNNPIEAEGLAALLDAIKSNKGLISAYLGAPIYERESEEWEVLRTAARENAMAFKEPAELENWEVLRTAASENTMAFKEPAELENWIEIKAFQERVPIAGEGARPDADTGV